MKLRRPMKGADLCDGPLEDIDEEMIPFPVYGTPKFDGIRCCIQNSKALTYRLKDIPNNYIRKLLSRKEFNGFDGELIVRQSVGDYFNNTQSGVMSHDGKPDFVFNVFDRMPQNMKEDNWGYLKRVLNILLGSAYHGIEFIEPVKISNMKELVQFEQSCLKKGYEGVVLRTGYSPYKYGRSTLRQFWMVKYKRFHNIEARVVGFKELMSNRNESVRDTIGHINRSSSNAGMVPMNMLGALEVVEMKDGKQIGKAFSVGSGFTLKQRKEIWRNKEKYKNRILTCKYQKHGMKDLPRFVTFKGWRLEEEI